MKYGQIEDTGHSTKHIIKPVIYHDTKCIINHIMEGLKSMKTIAFGTLKGGTGKTAVAFNIGGILAEKHRVLCIDVDPQSNLTSNIGLDTTVQDAPSVRDIFEISSQATPEMLITVSPIPELPNLDVIASHIRLTATEMQLVARAGREKILQKWIQKYHEQLKGYDYILIDTNPSMGIVNQNAFVAADSIVLVSDISEESKMGAMQFMYLWDEIREAYDLPNNVHALLLNNVDQRISQSGQLWEYFLEDEDFGDLLLKHFIPYRAHIKRTAPNCMPINVLAPKSDTCAAVRIVVDDLKERGVL